MLSVYYDKICVKFASHHLLLYVVYMCQKSLNFTCAFKCYQQKCKWLHFSWATLYVTYIIKLHIDNIDVYTFCRAYTLLELSLSIRSAWIKQIYIRDTRWEKKSDKVFFWLCVTFLCQTYSLPFSCRPISISPALTAPRPASNPPNVTLLVTKETYLLLWYLSYTAR